MVLILLLIYHIVTDSRLNLSDYASEETPTSICRYTQVNSLSTELCLTHFIHSPFHLLPTTSIQTPVMISLFSASALGFCHFIQSLLYLAEKALSILHFHQPLMDTVQFLPPICSRVLLSFTLQHPIHHKPAWSHSMSWQSATQTIR